MLPEEGRPDLALKGAHKLLAPQPQRTRIVAANIFDVLDNERALGLGGDVVEQLGDGRQVAAGEYVMGDEASEY